jgi:hypothetical protein
MEEKGFDLNYIIIVGFYLLNIANKIKDIFKD